ncbi:MAG: hypothetical protein DRP70_14630 [Spirochaetes bacterium]|nr:MAG: hypothetical protein DRP70_14630 [Spirochaetota bacterium]
MGTQLFLLHGIIIYPEAETNSIKSSSIALQISLNSIEKYAAKYGMFRLDRIQQVGEQFSICGDYLQGIVKIHGYAMFPALARK